MAITDPFLQKVEFLPALPKGSVVCLGCGVVATLEHWQNPGNHFRGCPADLVEQPNG